MIKKTELKITKTEAKKFEKVLNLLWLDLDRKLPKSFIKDLALQTITNYYNEYGF